MKKIAPVIITVIAVIYLSGYAYTLLFVMKEGWGIGKILLGIIALAVIGVLAAMIFTLVQRLREIDKEDDDDLSKY